MPDPSRQATLDALRHRIARIEGVSGPARAVLPFGTASIDACLPGGGMALGALHEIAGHDGMAGHDAAAACFAAGIAARVPGAVLWILRDRDLYPPGLQRSGLALGRIVHVTAPGSDDMLSCFEDALRHGGIGVVIAEIGALPMVASRRLHLAAEASGTLGIALRRRARDLHQPNACVSRWRIASLPSVALPAAVPGVGRARWRIALARVRGGVPADFIMEACDDRGYLAPCRLALPAVLGDRPDTQVRTRARA